MARRVHNLGSVVAFCLVAGGLVVSGCGKDESDLAANSESRSVADAGSSDAAAWSSWPAQSEREVTSADVGPLCLTFTGKITGTYAEHVSPDERSSIGVFELVADEDELDELEALYRQLDDCRDDELRIEQLDATDTSVSWGVQVVVDDIAGEPEFLGFSRRGGSARIIFGSGPDAPGADGESSWTL